MPRPDIKSSYLICSTPRTGSYLLAEAFVATKTAGRPWEYFDYRHRALWTERLHITPEDNYLDKLLEAGTTPNGVFGSKVHWFQTGDMADILGRPGAFGDGTEDVIGQALPGLRYIYLHREDKVRQAISLFRAEYTRVWWHISGAQQAPVDEEKLREAFDFAAIDAYVEEMKAHHLHWQRYFQQRSIRTFTMTYEQLVTYYDEMVLAALRWLELPLPDKVVTPRLIKQADALSEEWLERYCRMKAEQ